MNRKTLNKLVPAFAACAILGNCAFATAVTIVAAAPALAPYEPNAKSAPPYQQTVSGVTFNVRPWLRRACAAKPSALENRQGVWQCAKLVFPPQSGLSSQKGLRIAKTVIAKNPHMMPTGVDDQALIAGNQRFMSNNDPNIANTFSFPYYTKAKEQVVFAQ